MIWRTNSAQEGPVFWAHCTIRPGVQIIDFMAANPRAGSEIPGTGGARKVRFAAKGKGKSGGVSVITFYSGIEIPVFLLNVFAKNEKIDLSAAERNMLKKTLGQLVQVYKRRS